MRKEPEKSVHVLIEVLKKDPFPKTAFAKAMEEIGMGKRLKELEDLWNKVRMHGLSVQCLVISLSFELLSTGSVHGSHHRDWERSVHAN